MPYPYQPRTPRSVEDLEVVGEDERVAEAELPRGDVVRRRRAGRAGVALLRFRRRGVRRGLRRGRVPGLLRSLLVGEEDRVELVERRVAVLLVHARRAPDVARRRVR